MRLADLSPDLLRVCDDGSYRVVGMLCEAHGIMFDCPQCDGVKAHSICVWFADRGAPEGEEPAARWGASGTGLDNLTLHPSINVIGCWHGWVREGEVS